MDLLTDAKRRDFVLQCLEKNGCYYCWPTEENKYSGKGAGGKYLDVYDCSGLVTSSIYEATGVDMRNTYSAQKLYDQCILVDKPRTGDLVFYGYGKNMITHVMVIVGPGCFGMCGGTSHTVTPDIAKSEGARAKLKEDYKWRHDFIAVGRLQDAPITKK